MSNITFLSAPEPFSINPVSATSYALTINDQLNGIVCSNTANVVVTIPTNASVAFPLYTKIAIRQGNTGIVSISNSAGVTLLSPNGANTTAAGDVRVIEQLNTNVWTIY